MKYRMKNLTHNGIYVPVYEFVGLSVKVHGQVMKLSPRTEQMAVAWARKKLSAMSPPDKLFYLNFIQDFLEALIEENPSQTLKDFAVNHVRELEKNDDSWIDNGKLRDDPEIDFSLITEYVLREQQKKLSMSKEEKKKLASERKVRREALKQKYGYAVVDDQKLEIANWTAEPSCIFAGRGDHPKRGKWKQGPAERDIILNLSDKSSVQTSTWKSFTWEPEKMYIAKWEDKLSGKVKYVWFSDSAFLKQKAEKEKFKKAEKLDKEISKVREHIMKNLESSEIERRKLATACWLILEVNMRVGDEKDPDEADTVGAITLRPEHIKIEGNMLNFDFLGKDCVRWEKQVEAPLAVVRNIQELSKQTAGYLFEGIDSRKVSRFLSEKMDGLTAKVFRTWKCTQTVRTNLETCKARKEDPDYEKQYCAKIANLEAAKIANHKRKIPPNFDERLKKKENRVKELELKLKLKEKEGKKTEATSRSLEKTKLDLKLTRETREYNLGTSLKSYINPMVYVKWANNVNFPLDKLYPLTLRKKFTWALGPETKQ